MFDMFPNSARHDWHHNYTKKRADRNLKWANLTLDCIRSMESTATGILNQIRQSFKLTFDIVENVYI